MKDKEKVSGWVALVGCLGVGALQVGIFVGVIYLTVKLVKLFW